MLNYTNIMQFYGGPLDGHIVLVGSFPDAMVTFETTLVRPKLSAMERLVRFLLLDFRSREEVKIIATYRLDRQAGKVGYVHLGSRRENRRSAFHIERSTSECG